MSSSAYHRQETPLATMQRPPTPSASHALAINFLARAQFYVYQSRNHTPPVVSSPKLTMP